MYEVIIEGADVEESIKEVADEVRSTQQ
jgi:hypothetical protein